MYVKNEEVKEINFLASAKYHNYTRQIDNKGVVANAKGRKIVKAGTVYRNSQGVAIGLVFNDVDVTEGPQPGAVMYEGWVLAARLPEKIADADKATMPGIHFKDEYETQSAASYKKTTDAKYLEDKDYFKRVGDVYAKLLSGTAAEVTAGTADYTVGGDVSGTIFEKE